jgi:hypothetical protein
LVSRPNSDLGLDGYLNGWIKRQTANYVAVVLERVGVVDLDRERPAKIRLTDRGAPAELYP